MDLVKHHQENQEKIFITWREVLKKGRENIHKKYHDKKSEVKEQINKLLAKEHQSLEQLIEFEKERSDEILKQSMTFQQNSHRIPSKDDNKTEEQKNYQFNNLWSETIQELNVVIERQRDRLKQLDESLRNVRIGPTPTSAQNVNALREQRNSIHEQQTNNVNEFHRKLDQIHNEMDKINHQIEDNDKKEREELEKLLNKCRNRENEEKEKLWKKLMNDIKGLT